MPVEVHEHFDVDGTPTGTTVVTRESPWDDAARGRALRLAEYEENLCKCGCGLPMGIAHDPAAVFIVDKFTCAAGSALEQVKRVYRDANKDKPDGHDDGLHFFVRPHDPDRDEPLRAERTSQ